MMEAKAIGSTADAAYLSRELATRKSNSASVVGTNAQRSVQLDARMPAALGEKRLEIAHLDDFADRGLLVL